MVQFTERKTRLTDIRAEKFTSFCFGTDETFLFRQLDFIASNSISTSIKSFHLKLIRVFKSRVQKELQLFLSSVSVKRPVSEILPP